MKKVYNQQGTSYSGFNNQFAMPKSNNTYTVSDLKRPVLQQVNSDPCYKYQKYFISKSPKLVTSEHHLQQTRQLIKTHAQSLLLDYETLVKESNEVKNSLPSSRSMYEMDQIPHSWSELYEQEAWELPQNQLLDKKFHWWRKVDMWWQNFKSVDPKTKNSFKLKDYSSNIQDDNKDQFFAIHELTKHLFKPISSNFLDLSPLGKRRKAINQWIIDVSITFDFNCSTYNLCMQLLDAYLDKKCKSNSPVDVESVQELMVVCISCLLLSAAIREHRNMSYSQGYLKIIMQSSKHKFTFQDVIIAQTDILNTINPRFLASFIFFDYCLFFLAELRDAKFPLFDLINLFDFVQTCGLLSWLFKMIHEANKLIVDQCINMCVPGSRLAACFLLSLLSDFCGKDMLKNTKWFRLFSHHILHMYFDGDISFWLTLLQDRMNEFIRIIELNDSHSKALSTLWKIASEKWKHLEDSYDTNQFNLNNYNSYLNNQISNRFINNKRDRPYTEIDENVSPTKQQKLLTFQRIKTN